MPILSLSSQHPIVAPKATVTNRLKNPANAKVGYAAAAPLLKLADFINLGTTTVNQSKAIYASIFCFRLWKSRSINEFLENARRDALGIYSWFMGSPLLQTGIVLGLIPAISPGSRDLMLRRFNQHASVFHKVLYTLFSPPSRWKIISDTQLLQRKTQIMESMKALGHTAKLAGVNHRFEQAITMRALTSALGIAFTVAFVGMGVNFINIAMTRASLRKRSQGKAPVKPKDQDAPRLSLPPEIEIAPEVPVHTQPTFVSYPNTPWTGMNLNAFQPYAYQAGVFPSANTALYPGYAGYYQR